MGATRSLQDVKEAAQHWCKIPPKIDSAAAKEWSLKIRCQKFMADVKYPRGEKSCLASKPLPPEPVNQDAEKAM